MLGPFINIIFYQFEIWGNSLIKVTSLPKIAALLHDRIQLQLYSDSQKPFFSSMSYSIFSTLYSVNPKVCTLRAKAATHGAGLSHAGKKASLGLIYSLPKRATCGSRKFSAENKQTRSQELCWMQRCACPWQGWSRDNWIPVTTGLRMSGL